MNTFIQSSIDNSAQRANARNKRASTSKCIPKGCKRTKKGAVKNDTKSDGEKPHSDGGDNDAMDAHGDTIKEPHSDNKIIKAKPIKPKPKPKTKDSNLKEGFADLMCDEIVRHDAEVCIICPFLANRFFFLFVIFFNFQQKARAKRNLKAQSFADKTDH